MPEALARKLEEVIGLPFVEGYGLSGDHGALAHQSAAAAEAPVRRDSVLQYRCPRDRCRKVFRS
jgi:hypothetical protein